MDAAGEDRRVFVYGSLLDEVSLMVTLGHRSGPPASRRFELAGWERAWNVVSARTFARAEDPTGALVRRVVLGLRSAPAARCEGLLLELTGADLVALAPREAAYELTRVGGSGDEAVWAFVPRSERIVGATVAAEPLVVERSYVDRCRAGASAHGLHLAVAEISTALGDLSVVDPAPGTSGRPAPRHRA